MVELFYSLPLEFSPGATWSYSNTGYYLLGKIGEVITGKPFFELVEDKVTAPLQMYHTKANELAAKEQCLAKGYFQKDAFFTTSRILHSNYAFSAGAWATTGQDMIRYLKAIHKRNLPSDRAGFDWRKPPYSDELPFTYNAGRFIQLSTACTLSPIMAAHPVFRHRGFMWWRKIRVLSYL
jgi:CubicO group peptidase (beta-lactamase class C family)